MSELVCAGCGCAEFTQTRTTRTEYTLRFDAACGPMECSETVVDGGDLDDGDLTCQDCGASFDIGDMDDRDVLIPEDEYGRDEDDPGWMNP